MQSSEKNVFSPFIWNRNSFLTFKIYIVDSKMLIDENICRSRSCSPTAQTGSYAELFLLQSPQLGLLAGHFSLSVKNRILRIICIGNNLLDYFKKKNLCKILLPKNDTSLQTIKTTCPCLI